MAAPPRAIKTMMTKSARSIPVRPGPTSASTRSITSSIARTATRSAAPGVSPKRSLPISAPTACSKCRAATSRARGTGAPLRPVSHPPPPRTSLNLADSSPHCATIDVHAVASNVPSALGLSPLRASRASPTPTYLRRQRARVRRTRAPISSHARIATGARQRSASSLKSLTAFTRNSQSYATVERPG